MYPTDAILLSMCKVFVAKTGKNSDLSNNNHKRETEKYTQVAAYVILLHEKKPGTTLKPV